MMEHGDNEQMMGMDPSKQDKLSYGSEDVDIPNLSSIVLNRLGLGSMPFSSGTPVNQLIAALGSRDWTLRVAAAQALGKVREHISVEHLIRALGDEHVSVRAAAARSLGELGELEPLLTALQDVSWEVRADAAEALGKLGENVPIEPLVAVLDDEDEAVRAAAIHALGQLGKRAPVEVIADLLRKDEAWSVRVAAAFALGALGERKRLVDLLSNTKEQDPMVLKAIELAQEDYAPVAASRGYAKRRDNGEHMPHWDPFMERRQIGNYRLIRLLGEGGFAKVYLGDHEHLIGKQAAIKILLAHLGIRERRRFQEEARIIARLDHPSIVQLQDYGLEENTPYLIMDYAPGGTLRQHYPTGTILPLDTVVSYVAQIAAALQYAHSQGVIHRDVKPENILLQSTNKVLLSDFGIATIIDTSNQNLQTIAGTIPYMAPEQLNGQPCPASDQYSLGIMAYELLSGTRPFTGSLPEIVNKHRAIPPAPLRDQVPTIPSEVEQVIMKALEKYPTQRHSSVEDFAKALEDAALQPAASSERSLVGAGVNSQATTVNASQPPSPPRRNPLLSRWQQTNKRGRISLILLLLVAFVIIGSIIKSGPPPPPPTCPTVPSTPIGADGIGVRCMDGEDIGISDGRFALDTSLDRKGREYKLQAAEKLRAGNRSAAISLWHTAADSDTNDAEPLIYSEDQRVLTSGSPYITLVVGVLLGTKNFDGFSRDALQSAYVAQKEYNDQHKHSGGVQLRLLIAKSGSDPSRSKEIAQQVVQAASFDKTFVGVMGWPTSTTSLDTIPIFTQNHIPMVAGGVTSDELTNVSSYFFRVGPPNKILVPPLAKNVENQLHPMRLVTFRDPADTYSQTLESDFVSQFKSDGYGDRLVSRQDISATESSQNVSSKVTAIVNQYHPDVIFFTPNRIGQMVALLNTAPPSIPVVMGVAGYEVVESDQHFAGYNRMRFSSSAFADEWDFLGLTAQKPAFFTDYAQDFNPDGQHTGAYGYTRPTSFVMLSYDAVLVLLEASRIALAGKNRTFTPGQQSITPEELENALRQIHGSQAVQGITGTISLGADGDPLNKEMFVLRVTSNGYTQIDSAQGCFLKTRCNQ